MGQFSWLDCVDGKPIKDNKRRDVYVLIPKEFGGGYLLETCYDGYGHFDGVDIYDLVATWNRMALSENPNYIIPSHHVEICNEDWYEFYENLNLSVEEVCNATTKKWGRNYPYEWRYLGIDLACYDEDNTALPFPIKITYHKNAIYEECKPSNSDPNQGW